LIFPKVLGELRAGTLLPIFLYPAGTVDSVAASLGQVDLFAFASGSLFRGLDS
jgi:hypothetical protein